MAMYDNENTLSKSFDLTYISAHLVQAQWAEFVELKKRIHEVYHRQKRPVNILDIGVGNGRVAMHLSGIQEIWDMIATYDGTDNAKACVELATRNFDENNIKDKATATLFAAENLHEWKQHYDLIVMTWFTAGNFYPDDFDFEQYGHSNPRLDCGIL